MPVIPVAAAIGAAATVAGTVISATNQAKALREQRKQNRFERQIATNRAQRERRDAIRTARLAAGASTQAAANQGASGTSAALGALGSISSQLNANLSFLDVNQRLSDQASLAAGRANAFMGRAQTGAAISSLGQSVFSAAGGFGAFDAPSGSSAAGLSGFSSAQANTNVVFGTNLNFRI